MRTKKIQQIWETITTIINASIQIGRGPTRYETVHQLMAEKVPGVRTADKLRRLNKYESEYNLILKNKWPYHGAQNAEKNNLMGTNQFGGRKGYNSLQAAIINELIIEYHRITYKPLSIMQHDVKACFDRTIPSITTICNRKFNIPMQICKFVNTTRKI